MSIERIVWLDGTSSELKAVQIVTEEGLFLVLGYAYHGELLDQFLGQKRIPYRKVRLVGDCPDNPQVHARLENAPDDPYYSVSGMGQAKREGQNLILSGKSIGYRGKEIDPEHIINLNKNLTDMQVRVK